MVKEHYLKEIVLSGRTVGKKLANNRKDVMKIQSWLNLYARSNPASATATAIDGDYGPATERAVRNYQQAVGLPMNGIVSAGVFDSLCSPMVRAYETPLKSNSLRDLVIEAAMLHLENRSFELTIRSQANSGPWVRSYMGGHEGNDWFWCMGFVQSILDQAASAQGKDFRKLMPSSYSCDIVAAAGIQKRLLTRFTAIRNDPSVVRPGDVFLLEKASNDWFHTGFVTGVKNDVFETIEGNTNEDGSHNGVGVYKRTRNFRASKLDVFSIEPLV